MKILILGHARHGKDTFAELLEKHHGLKFASSSEYACEHVVYPILKDEFNYESVAECFYLRGECRDRWKTIISDYNTPNKDRLCRELLATNDIYVGMRDIEEYEASCDFFDRTYYIDRYLHCKPDPTMGIQWAPEMEYIDNNGTLEELSDIARSLFK